MCVPTSTNTGVVESLKEAEITNEDFLDFGRRHPIIETDVPLVRLPAPAAAIPSTHREAPRLATDRREREGLERALARDVARAPLAQLMRQHGRCERPSIFRRRDATPRWNPRQSLPAIAAKPRTAGYSSRIQHATLAFQSNMCSKPRVVSSPRAHDGSGRTYRAAPRTRNRGGSASSSCSCSYSSARPSPRGSTQRARWGRATLYIARTGERPPA